MCSCVFFSFLLHLIIVLSLRLSILCNFKCRYTLTGWFGSDPWQHANVLCGNPLGHSAHPIVPNPKSGPCLSERGAGEWYLLRQGLEDVEYLDLLDRLAGEADKMHKCGYEDAVLRGADGRIDPTSPCCASLGVAKRALDAVDTVTWGVTSTGYGTLAPGDPPYNITESEPYVLHYPRLGIEG